MPEMADYDATLSADGDTVRERVDATIAQLRPGGPCSSVLSPEGREARVSLIREFGTRGGKAIILAARFDGELDGFTDTLGEDGVAPVREALRDAVTRYAVAAEAVRDA